MLTDTDSLLPRGARRTHAACDAAHLARWCVALVLLALGAGHVAAMSPPPGVVAIRAQDKGADDSLMPDRSPCGGSAVVVQRLGNGDALAVTLEEALPDAGTASRASSSTFSITLSGGLLRSARIERRGSDTTALLLRILAAPEAATPVAIADSARSQVGDEVWTAGNSYGSIEEDGQVALSRGIVSNRDRIPAGAPPVRGRGGRALSRYRGEVLETDAAINDGNQGGALLDAESRLIGLVSLGQVRERRLGTVVPIHLILADLGLGDLPRSMPATGSDPGRRALVASASRAAAAVVLIQLERPKGPGNPNQVPRPPRTVDEAPLSERKRLREWWGAYYHQQQVFYGDQPVCALVVGPGEFLTSLSNLHGDPERGRLLRVGADPVPVRVVARDLPLDLCLLRSDEPLALPAAAFAAPPHQGDAIALVGRHRVDAHTLSLGIVSADDRRLFVNGCRFAQTDALANYGVLGGALVDADGAVVGMSVLLQPDRSWLINSGVSLFVPAESLRDGLERLRTGRGRSGIERILIGIESVPLSDGGVRVHRVLPGSGAAVAGLRTGDIILRVDGDSVHDRDDLQRRLVRRSAGDLVVLDLNRGGVREAITVELRVLPERRP